METRRTTSVLVSALGAMLMVPGIVTAQDVVPPSTNPAERAVYPSEGQSADQQLSDQLACYNWAGENTGWDPHQAYAELEKEHGAALKQYQESQGGAVRGAARGALAGLAIGAIAGDAGQGAAIGAVAGGAGGGIRARRQRRGAQSDFEVAAEAFKEEFSKWDRQWVACMEGRDYSIS